ncbi:MAG: phosphoenolpyruvate synthase [Alphaproteobacteria bacterium]|nr:phosphoenolpyruvate synthase [Alphaproteobacteria bacterium]
MALAFGTKSETLERAGTRLVSARVLPQRRIAHADWRAARDAALEGILAEDWARGPLIARSSARNEDGAAASQAGKYLSIPHLLSRDALAAAIDGVFASYGDAGDDEQVFVQPMLRDVSLSGVAFTRDPNTGAPYVVVNYDQSGDTAAVTAGRAGGLRTYVHWKHHAKPAPAPLDRVLDLARELEILFAADALDIEFALTRGGDLVLLQVRPLAAAGGDGRVERESHAGSLAAIAAKLAAADRPHPYLRGRRTVFGVMPDWNPAEIVGVRPRPLALSLYRSLVTDSIWAYQRHNYGYRNLRSFPLLLSFHGLPYVDVRVSFNSFIPQDVDDALADRLVDHYVGELLAAPALHDKVEFEIVFSCYTFDLAHRMARLGEAGFAAAEIDSLADSLRRLTNRVISSRTGLWRQDSERIRELEERQAALAKADLDPVTRLYWLIEDCKRYGTLPFAGLARAGFIAVQMLNSLVAVGAIDAPQREQFLAGLDTVSTRLASDFAAMPREAFLERYGHLRPGTYDILSPRYDEAPERYFDWSRPAAAEPAAHAPFALSVPQMRRIERLIAEHRLDIDVVGLFEFLQAAIQGREYAKFVFTRSLSDVLKQLGALGEAMGFAREDVAYLDARVVETLHASSEDQRDAFARSIAAGRAAHALTRAIVLPPLLARPEDVYAFELPPTDPNFITQNAAEGPAVGANAPAERLRGAIVCIPNADPGFDWLFARGIAGLVTAYGGINSHMAIRAAELKLPAVIGAGETQYARWSKARLLRLDCGNRRVEAHG